MMSRREALATAVVAGVATAAATAAAAAPEKRAVSFGNPDDPPQGAINATSTSFRAICPATWPRTAKR